MMTRRDFRDRSEGGGTKTSRLTLVCPDFRDQVLPFADFRATKKLKRDFCDQCGNQRDPAPQETARPARPNSAFPDFPDGFVDGATFQPRRRRRDQESLPCEQGRDGASFQTNAEAAWLFRPWQIRRDFTDQGGVDTTFHTKAETARPRITSSRPRRRRHDYPDQGSDGATFQTKV